MTGRRRLAAALWAWVALALGAYLAQFVALLPAILRALGGT